MTHVFDKFEPFLVAAEGQYPATFVSQDADGDLVLTSEDFHGDGLEYIAPHVYREILERVTLRRKPTTAERVWEAIQAATQSGAILGSIHHATLVARALGLYPSNEEG